MGDLQLAAPLLVADGRLVQFRVLHGDGRLAGDARQDFQVVAAEAVPLVGSVDLDHARHLALAVDQRRAHHRADVEIDDAFRGLEAGVGRRVGREDGLLAGHHALHDRAADADRVDQFRAAMLQGPRNQLARGGVAEHDDAAIGLRKDRQQAVEHFRQHVVQRHGAAQVPADLHQGLELGLRIDLQPQARRTRGNVQPRHDRGIVLAGLVVDHQGRGLEIETVARLLAAFRLAVVVMEDHAPRRRA